MWGMFGQRTASSEVPRRERRSGRIPVGFYTELRDSAGTVHRCFVTSLGSRGMYAESLSRPADFADGKVWFELDLPGHPKPVPMVGEVLRAKDGEVFRELAIRFVAMAPGARIALNRWVIQALSA